jgi:hypothetical protein
MGESEEEKPVERSKAESLRLYSIPPQKIKFRSFGQRTDLAICARRGIPRPIQL